MNNLFKAALLCVMIITATGIGIHLSEDVDADSSNNFQTGGVTYATLAEAIEHSNNQTIVMTADSETTPLSIDESVTIDLGGHTLSIKEEGLKAIGLDFRAGPSEISNGTIKDERCKDTTYCGYITVRALGSNTSLTLDDVDIKQMIPNAPASKGYNYAVRSDYASLTLENGTTIDEIEQGNDATLRGTVGVAIFGPNDGSNKATLTIYDGVSIDTSIFAISGNGTTHGTEINIYGGTISSTYGTAIYHPQEGTLNIYGGEITGATGIEIRSGTLNVSGGTIVGNGDPFESDPNGNGTTTTGAGIAIVQHTTKKDITVTISGGSVSGYNAIYERDLQNNGNEYIQNININITGGIFESTANSDAHAIFVDDSEIIGNFISGGTYNTDASGYCIEGYAFAQNTDGTYTAESIQNYSVILSTDAYYINVNENATITATEAHKYIGAILDYKWSDGTSTVGTTPSLTVSPTQTTTYTLTVTGTNGAENVNFTASITISISEYTVTFNYDGQTEAQTVRGGTAASEPTEITAPQGYYLVWTTADGEQWDFSTPIIGDMTLTGTAVAIVPEVTFEYDGTAQTVETAYNQPVQVPDYGITEGLEIVWTTAYGQVWDPATPVTEDITVTGTLIVSEFEVTVEQTGSTVNGLTTTLTANVEDIEGIAYTFVWNTESTEQSIDVIASGDYVVTVTASYEGAESATTTASAHIEFGAYGFKEDGREIYEGFGDFALSFNDVPEGTTFSITPEGIVGFDNGTVSFIAGTISSDVTVTITAEAVYNGSEYSDTYTLVIHTDAPEVTTDPGVPDPVITVIEDTKMDEIKNELVTSEDLPETQPEDWNVIDIYVPVDPNIDQEDNVVLDEPVAITVPYSMFGVLGPAGFVFHVVHMAASGMEVLDVTLTDRGVTFYVNSFSPFAFYAEEVDQPALSVSISSDNSMPITGETVTLTANVPDGIQNVTYLWSTGETTRSIQVTEGGTYTVTVSTEYNGSVNTVSASYTVGFTSILSVSFTYDGETKGFGVYYNGTVNDPGFAVADGFAIQWTTSDGKVWVPGTPVRSSLSLTGTLVIAEPEVDITIDGDAIEGQTVTLTADVTAVDGIAYSYLWSNGATTQSIQVTGDGTYSVVVTASCDGMGSVTSDAKVTVDFRGVIVEFVADGRVTSVEVTPGQTVTAPAVQSVAGFDVVWMMADGQAWDLSAPVTEGMTLTAERVLQSPIVTVSDEGTTETGDVILSANVSNRNPSITYTYAWSDGSAARTTTVSESGTYTVTVTASYEGAASATGTAQVEVTVSGTGSGSGSGTSEVVVSEGGSDTTGILAVAAGVCAAALIALVVAAECRKR